MKVKLLNATHPSYDGPSLARLRALAAGGKAWRELISTWLPQRFAEPREVYKERQQLATYTNHSGSILGLLAALLFSDASKFEGLDGEWWTTFRGDVDRRGTAWDWWWREVFREAQTGQRAYVWVNLPSRADDAQYDNLAEEERAGALDAFLVLFTADQVIDWEVDDRGNLLWVIARDLVQHRPAPGAERTRVYRWTVIDKTHITRWSWTASDDKPEPNDEDDATKDFSFEHRVGRMPVVCVEVPEDLWLMGKLEDPATSALRARNEHSWALHQAANELLTITSKMGDTDPPPLGHGHFLQLWRDQSGEDKAAFVAPGGVAFEYLQQDVQDTREELYRVVQQMALAADSDATRTRMSGESKAQDWLAFEIVLQAYTDLMLGFMRRVLLAVAAARGERLDEGAVSVTGLDGWQREDLQTFFELLPLATNAARMSETFRRVAAKREARRLLGDEVDEETLDQIDTEIDSAQVDLDEPYLPPPRPGAKKPGKGPEDRTRE